MLAPWWPAGASAARPGDDEAGLAFFENEVRPLLAEHCVACHGPEQQKSALRLDGRQAFLAGGARGAAVVPGDADGSLLLHAVSYLDPDLQMPPRGLLSETQRATLRAWVERGAPAPDAPLPPPVGDVFDLEQRARHWSFQPVTDPPVPAVSDAEWPRHPLDAFILSRLDDAELSPAADADRATLARRLSFDLRGLPPTPAEVDAFLADPADDATALAALADRWLASPRFGETWGRHWLDLQRYAESKGHEFDFTIANAWQYRDYVIRALNADVPFDQFVIEHVAGDLLAEPRRHPELGSDESVLGTGSWFLGEEVHSPVDTLLDQADRTANKVDVFGKAFLGLTVACARCHDHKFDAIRATDYAALSGFVVSSRYRQVRFETDRDNAAVGAGLAALSKLAGPGATREVAAAMRRAFGVPGGTSLAPELVDADREGGSLAADRRLSSWRAAPTTTTRWHPDHGALRQDGVAFLQGRPGDVLLGPADLTEAGEARERVIGVLDRPAAVADPVWRVLRPAPGTEPDPGAVSWDQPGRTLHTETFTLETGRVFALVRGGGHVYVAVDGHRMIHGPLHGAHARTFEPAEDGGWHWVEVDLTNDLGHRAHVEFTPGADGVLAVAEVVEAAEAPPSTGEPRTAWTDRLAAIAAVGAGPGADVGVPAVVSHEIAAVSVRVAAGPADEVDAIDAWVLDVWARSSDAPAQGGAQTAGLLLERKALAARIRPESHTAPALMDGSGIDEFLFVRGNTATPGAPTPRRFLEALGGHAGRWDARGSGRLELARRLVDPANPLTARVFVNRVWHHLFGRGLVPTVDDFGHMGEAPSHPALLDHLAVRFMREGWSVKRLLRELVTSRTYSLDSEASPRAVEIDPTNVLLQHHSVRRLPAEAVRDAVLAVSGTLDTTVGGPPVPLHLSEFQQGRGRPPSGSLDGEGRRTVYLSVRRNFLSALLLVHDFPIPFTAMGRRARSNVPAQALALLNDPFVVQESRRWAERLLAEGPAGTDARLEWLYREAFARGPSAAERAAARTFVADVAPEDVAPGAVAPGAVAPGAVAPGAVAPEGVAPGDIEAWADLCHVLLNVKEFVFLR